MKISTVFLIIIALEFSIIMFNQGAYVDETPFLTNVLNPTLWGSSSLWMIFVTLAGVAVVAGSYAGQIIMGKNDLAVFALFVSGSVITWMAPIATLWRMVYTDGLFPTSDVAFAGVNVSANSLIASILVAPLIILAFWATLNWWRTAFAEG